MLALGSIGFLGKLHEIWHRTSKEGYLSAKGFYDSDRINRIFGHCLNVVSTENINPLPVGEFQQNYTSSRVRRVKAKRSPLDAPSTTLRASFGYPLTHDYWLLAYSLLPGKRRTTSQLARDLGISRSQIVQWVKEGKIRPVSGPGIDKSGHYLFVCQPRKRINL